MVIHQTNHLRIQELRRTTESLDQTIKDTVRLIADTRKDILAIPSSTNAESRREVKVDELLSYAKFISKTTVPPTFRKPVPEISLSKLQIEGKAAEHVTNGIATPPPGGEGVEQAVDQGAENAGIQAMDQQAKMWLDPLKNLPFEPWPSHAVIQQGGLAAIQKMLDSGKDPASVLSAEEQAEADRLKREEEERERVEQEERERRRMSMFQGAGRRGTAADDVFDPDEA